MHACIHLWGHLTLLDEKQYKYIKKNNFEGLFGFGGSFVISNKLNKYRIF